MEVPNPSLISQSYLRTDCGHSSAAGPFELRTAAIEHVLRRRSLCATCTLVDDGRMDRKEDGAKFQIVVDGKSRSYRDERETAVEAGMFLKERYPQSESSFLDVQSGVQTVIGRSTFVGTTISILAQPLPICHLPAMFW